MDAKYNLAFLELDAKCSKKKLRELLKSCGNDTEAISEQMKKMEGMMVLYGEQARFCHAGSNDKCAVDGEAFDNQQEVYQPSF